MKLLTVINQTANSHYDITVGSQVIGLQLHEFSESEKPSKVVVVADKNSPSDITKHISDSFTSCAVFELTASEGAKSPETLLQLLSWFAEQKLDRKSLVVGVGGGVLLDLVGFAASIYMRGVDFISIPTTLLAQVDASIGGKVGINFLGVKNLIGSVKNPRAVIIDLEALKTLPTSQIKSGFSEILKHGLILDRKYFKYVSSKKCTDWSLSELSDIIFESCQIKKNIVESDPFENGLRAILNFGHSVGHAIESLSHSLAKESSTKESLVAPLLHGEAVALGMVSEIALSRELSNLDLEEALSGISNAGILPVISDPFDFKALVKLIASDKKNHSGVFKFVKLRSIGEAVWNQTVSAEELYPVLSELKYAI